MLKYGLMTDNKGDYKDLLWRLYAITPSSRELGKVKLIETSIPVFAKNGVNKQVFSEIAKRAGVSRALLYYHFKNENELFDRAMIFVRNHGQNFIIREMQKAKGNARDELHRYVKAQLNWASSYPNFVRVHLMYYPMASRHKKLREKNTELVKTGKRRIAAILEVGEKQGLWRIDSLERTAQRIHMMLTGAFVSLLTENRENALEDLSELVIEQLELSLR